MSIKELWKDVGRKTELIKEGYEFGAKVKYNPEEEKVMEQIGFNKRPRRCGIAHGNKEVKEIILPCAVAFVVKRVD